MEVGGLVAILKDESGFYALRKYLSQNSKEMSELEDVGGKNVASKRNSQS